MSLEKLAQLGWYKAEPSSPKEITDLFSIVDRSQADSKVEGISDDLRFQAAYTGILTLANSALRASGFRVSLGQGHHQLVIESLEYTLTTQDATAREKWVRKVKSHSQKRNIIELVIVHAGNKVLVPSQIVCRAIQRKKRLHIVVDIRLDKRRSEAAAIHGVMDPQSLQNANRLEACHILKLCSLVIEPTLAWRPGPEWNCDESSLRKTAPSRLRLKRWPANFHWSPSFRIVSR